MALVLIWYLSFSDYLVWYIVVWLLNTILADIYFFLLVAHFAPVNRIFRGFWFRVFRYFVLTLFRVAACPQILLRWWLLFLETVQSFLFRNSNLSFLIKLLYFFSPQFFNIIYRLCFPHHNIKGHIFLMSFMGHLHRLIFLNSQKNTSGFVLSFNNLLYLLSFLFFLALLLTMVILFDEWLTFSVNIGAFSEAFMATIMGLSLNFRLFKFESLVPLCWFFFNSVPPVFLLVSL